MNQPVMGGVATLNAPSYIKQQKLINWVAEIATLTNPQLSTVAIDVQQIGAHAISTLLSMIEQQSAPTVQTIPTRLVVRRSTGPRRESSTHAAAKIPLSSREQADPPARKRGRPPRVPITT